MNRDILFHILSNWLEPCLENRESTVSILVEDYVTLYWLTIFSAERRLTSSRMCGKQTHPCRKFRNVWTTERCININTFDVSHTKSINNDKRKRQQLFVINICDWNLKEIYDSTINYRPWVRMQTVNLFYVLLVKSKITCMCW